MFCIICGTENPDYARFCRKCGRLIPEEVENRSKCESAPKERPMPAQEKLRSESSSQRSTFDELKVEEFAQPYRHLTADELSSLNTGFDGLLPGARTALEAKLQTRPEPCPSEVVPNQRLPYRWGKFQGWVSLVVGLFAAIFLLPALVSGMSLDENSASYAILCPLLIASGYAFVRRKRYAVLMTYLWMGFCVLAFLPLLVDGLTNKSLTPEQQGHEIGAGLAQMVIGTMFWGLCAVYYRKRRSEFASELSSKAARQGRSKNESNTRTEARNANPEVRGNESISARRKPFMGIVVRIVVSSIFVLLFAVFWGSVISTHEPDAAAERLAGPLGGLLGLTVPWLLGSAYSKWKRIPSADKEAPELGNLRLASRIAVGFLLATLAGTALLIAVPLEQRREQSKRVKLLLDEAKALEPASTRNRLEVRSITNRDVRNYADFRKQCAELRAALDENNTLATKRNELRKKLSYEYRDNPDALSMVVLLSQIDAEDAKASSVFRNLIACSDTLATSDETQQKRFLLLCVAPALPQLELSASTMNNLLKLAQQKGAKLPPDVLEAFE
jgi:hypothetical protein